MNNKRRLNLVTLKISVVYARVVKWIEEHSDFKKSLLLFFCKKLNKPECSIAGDLLNETLMRIEFCVQQILSKDGNLRPSSKLSGLYGVELIRVGGRLRNPGLPYDHNQQFLLIPDSNLGSCQILHQKCLHAGTDTLMPLVRQKFWIVTGKCIFCFRCKMKLTNQFMCNLPYKRVQVAKPFSTTGLHLQSS